MTTDQLPYRLAIDLKDLDRLDPVIRTRLLKGRLDLANPIQISKDRAIPDHAIPFSCGLLSAATICDIIRSEDRKSGDFPTQLYIYKTTWNRIPSHVALTIQVKGSVKLNPTIFPAVAVTLIIPPPQAVDF